MDDRPTAHTPTVTRLRSLSHRSVGRGAPEDGRWGLELRLLLLGLRDAVEEQRRAGADLGHAVVDADGPQGQPRVEVAVERHVAHRRAIPPTLRLLLLLSAMTYVATHMHVHMCMRMSIWIYTSSPSASTSTSTSASHTAHLHLASASFLLCLPRLGRILSCWNDFGRTWSDFGRAWPGLGRI